MMTGNKTNGALLTISISTRNRLESLVRCLQSLVLISDFVREIIVVDDCSEIPLEEPLRQSLGADFPLALRVIRHETNSGYIVARNTIVQSAATDFILNLDDDAFIIEPDAIRRALDVIRNDEQVAVVAFAQANEDGNSWPNTMQPSPVTYDCYIPSFIGFAHILRRNIFLSLGGYRSSFYFYGEEKEYCLRLLDAGYDVVYLPSALVAHVPDPAGRNAQKYLRYTVRNNCLGAIYNEPLVMMLPGVAARLLLYFRMKRGWKIHDPGGFTWIVKQVLSSLPAAWRERRSLKWATFRQWRKLRQSWPPYPIEDKGLAKLSNEGY